MGEPQKRSFESRWLARRKDRGLGSLGPTTFLACGDSVLPAQAAPFVSFDEAEKMPRLWEIFGPPGSWSPEAKARVSGFRMIGSDGCGNPICIEDETGIVWMLDHEDSFRTRQFVNSSVALLAECLLACMGQRDPSQLRRDIRKLDRPATAKNTFWDQAATDLESIGE